MSTSRRDWLFALVIITICIGLYFVDLAGIPTAPSGLHARGRVIAVDNSNVRTNLIVKTESQFLTVRLLNGPHQGQELTITNMLTGKMEFDEFYEAGATVLVEYDMAKGKPANGLARGHYRLRLQLVLIGLFGLLLIGVAGVTGLKALLSFVFTAMVLWKVFFPLLLKGFAPLPTGMAVVGIFTAVVTFSVGGMNRRGIATFAGSMMGVSLTCLLAVLFTQAFALHGAVRPFAETLLYSGYYDLQLTDIFIAGVFIASSGAVMDLAMDIAAAMDEIKQKNPDIGFRDHLRSGLRVGRAVIGTMTTTLLLAYSSSHITMFLLFMAKGLPSENILNAPFVAAEILNILVGSFGLVTVAPFTALVAGLLYHWKPSMNKERL
ncbi:MAG: YibE/F family protein [Proteobacteria bacterium]|nr:YibE/F family protein [Pseudomonadota bacterium]MBU1387941.1 YibE/F family protein [Pseudomonadota bacterium]MBU1542004.1 YibE/F family protein [Pseudomonadota bacterium]MBU2430571.1 YibE/F family protein [Pseudomonadota bacterium]MBU2482076.1 YibE/F family protein [Pseudomonadota bacterium]